MKLCKSLLIAVAIALFPSAVMSQTATKTYTVGNYTATVPDWSKITWDNLPSITEAGYIKIPSNLVSIFGYDPSRSWSAGQKVAEVVMLGDAEDALKMGNFTLKKITSVSLSSSINSTLDSVGFMKWQSVESLVEAIPKLGNLSISKVKPIAEIFDNISCGTINNCLKVYSSLGEKLLGDNLDLSKYSISSIPGLDTTQIRNFKQWQQTYINQIPNLSSVPFDKMPLPINSDFGVVGIASVVFGQTEQASNVGDSYYISGSVVRGDRTVNKACTTGKKCAYLELGDFTANAGLYGKRWASGTGSPQVKGGYGFLAAVNNGKEPTGRLVYGSAFKVVLTATNESTGTADFALYFRICVRPPFMAKTCTPYFIGPIPWIPVEENDLVIVGTGQ